MLQEEVIVVTVIRPIIMIIIFIQLQSKECFVNHAFLNPVKSYCLVTKMHNQLHDKYQYIKSVYNNI
jgi:hypothetical protein